MPILSRKLKSALRPYLPAWLRHAALNWQSRHPRYRTGSPAEVFGAIYRDGIWGSGDDFMSGSGSRDTAVVQPYVAAVRSFAGSAGAPLAAVDLGCGDFAVGSQLVSAFERYTACDVVPALVERNRSRFGEANLTFSVVDIVADPLPKGDVALVRQVLQHLSNQQVGEVLRKLEQYRYIIVTEHVPAGRFTPNRDKVPGPHTRLDDRSGVVLDAPPFDFARTGRVLCRVEDRGSVIETTLWS